MQSDSIDKNESKQTGMQYGLVKKEDHIEDEKLNEGQEDVNQIFENLTESNGNN